MAQPGEITVKLDTREARKSVRALLSLARDANAALARLDEQFTALEAHAEELAAYGIRLEVSPHD